MRLAGLTTMLAVVPLLALAQEPTQPGPETLLHLSATGSVIVSHSVV